MNSPTEIIRAAPTVNVCSRPTCLLNAWCQDKQCWISMTTIRETLGSGSVSCWPSSSAIVCLAGSFCGHASRLHVLNSGEWRLYKIPEVSMT